MLIGGWALLVFGSKLQVKWVLEQDEVHHSKKFGIISFLKDLIVVLCWSYLAYLPPEI
jgi:hypothetical protein